jgi:hypothetical protein
LRISYQKVQTEEARAALCAGDILAWRGERVVLDTLERLVFLKDVRHARDGA